MFYAQLSMDSMNFVYLVFKFKAERHFLIKSLFSLLEVLHQHCLVVRQVVICIPEVLQFFKYLDIFLVVYLLVVLYNLLTLLYLRSKRIHLGHLVTLDLTDHRLELTIGTVLKQNSIDLPKRFTNLLAPKLFQERVETHRIDKQRSKDSVQVLRIDPLGKQRVFIDSVLLQGRILDSHVKLFICTVFQQGLIEPLLKMFILQLSLPTHFLLLFRKFTQRLAIFTQTKSRCHFLPLSLPDIRSVFDGRREFGPSGQVEGRTVNIELRSFLDSCCGGESLGRQYFCGAGCFFNRFVYSPFFTECESKEFYRILAFFMIAPMLILFRRLPFAVRFDIMILNIQSLCELAYTIIYIEHLVTNPEFLSHQNPLNFIIYSKHQLTHNSMTFMKLHSYIWITSRKDLNNRIELIHQTWSICKLTVKINYGGLIYDRFMKDIALFNYSQHFESPYGIYNILSIEMENQKEPETSKIEAVSQPLTQCNYTSRFFGNYLDNSQIDLSGSDLSVSIDRSESNPAEMQERVRAESLLFLDNSRKRRIRSMAIQLWRKQKESLVRLEKRTPTYVAKVLRKICMFVNVKIKSKCHIFFSKVKKMIKDADSQPQLQKQNPPPVQNSSESSARDRKVRGFVTGFLKLDQTLQKLSLKYFNSLLQVQAFSLLQSNLQSRNLLLNLSCIIDNQQKDTLYMSWTCLQRWLRYLSKIEILTDTISLLLNQHLRKSLLQINLNAIRGIQQQRVSSRVLSEQSIEMTQKQQSYEMRLNRIEECRSEKGKEQQEWMGEQKPGDLFKKQSDGRHFTVPEISINSIKAKKFSEVELPSNTKMVHTQAQKGFSQRSQNYSIKTHSQGYYQEEYSIVKAEQTPSSALSSPRSRVAIPKKVTLISLQPLKGCNICTSLSDNDNQIINIYQQGIFTNVTQSLRSRPLKNDDIHHELTDFNDLFFSRQILNFYLVFDPPIQTQKLMRTNPSFNKDEYSYLPSEKGSRTKGSRKGKQHTVASETFIEGAWNRLSVQDRYDQRMQYGGQPQSCHYLSPPSQLYRQKQMKIPTELPKNFDYYANKSHSRRKSQKKSSTKSDEVSFLAQRLRDVASSASKKKIFNTVKSGNSSKFGLRLGEAAKREQTCGEAAKVKRSVDRKKSMINREEINTSRRSRNKNREVGVSPMQQGSRGEYLMSFRGCPPKKKVKKVQ